MSTSEVTLAADGLRVVFFKQGDRYAHRIEVLDDPGQNWVAVLESLEGTPDDDWPPSPPLQQLHVERRPTGSVVLLVGMAGRTHWSAAVEVAADRNSVRFDVAVRVQLPPQRLASSYRREDQGPSTPKHPVQLRSTSTIESGPLRIVPDGMPVVPGTIGWKYDVRRGAERP